MPDSDGMEYASSLIAKLEEVAGGAVMADVEDLQSLAVLFGHLESLGELADEHHPGRLAEAVKAMVDLVERMIYEEVDPAQGMEVVNRSLTVLQQAIHDGRSPEGIPFPEALGVRPVKKTEGAGADVHGGPSAPADSGEVPSELKFTLPANVDEKIFNDFIARQSGVLEEAERLILAMESGSTEELGEYRRLVHTLKGEAGLLGLDAVSELCHSIEDALDSHPPSELGDGLLKATDWLRKVFEAYAGASIRLEPVNTIIQALVPTADPGEPEPDQAEPEQAVDEGDSAEVDSIPEPEVDEHLGGDPFHGNAELVADFVLEADEHLQSAEVHLLDVESDPDNIDALNAVFRAFHTIKGVSGFLELTEMQELAHQAEAYLDLGRKGKLRFESDAIELLFDAVDGMKRMIGLLSDGLRKMCRPASDPVLPDLVARLKEAAASGQVPQTGTGTPLSDGRGKKVGELLVESGKVSPDQVEAAAAVQASAEDPKPKIGEVLARDHQVPAREVAHALRSQRGAGSAESTSDGAPAAPPAPVTAPKADKPAVHAPTASETTDGGNRPATRSRLKETVKVDAERLDQLVDTIGELVIAEAMVSQMFTTADRDPARTARQIGHLNKITRELHEMATSLRMVPLRSTFERMARVVRDVSRKLGKPIDFVMQGQDTELDKTVVDSLGDPLIHMVRNSVDHGIEDSVETRRAAGKPAKGRVVLRAYHKGGNVYVEIEDDGKGIDRDVILAKGREAGLVAEGQHLSDEEIYSLIFQPGFSTAKSVTDISGRGVGMDVVRRHIESLRGQVEVRSELGKGSVFAIRLPLTLAVIEGMVIRVAGHRYVIPTLSILRMLQPTREMISTAVGRGEMLSLGGDEDLIPLFRLDRLFNHAGGVSDPTDAMVVILENGGKRVGLVTDELVGQQQIVVKSLSESLKKVPGIAGGTIMADGRVGLILDIEGLVRLAHGDGINESGSE